MARMRRLRARILLAAFVAGAAATAFAEEPLTLDQAIHEALTHNASLRAARAGAAEMAQNASSARSGWFPRLSVSESWQRGDQPVFVFGSLLSARKFAAENFAIDALNHPDPLNFFRTSIGLEQVLFDGGKQRAGVNEAKFRSEIASLTTDEAAAGLALATTQAYGRILMAEAGSRAADAGLRAAREDLARAEARRDSGTATDADVLTLAAHVADLQQRTIQLRSDADIARAELNRLMGTPIDLAFDVVTPQTPPRVAGDLSALLAEADRTRPELKRAAAGVDLAETGRSAARSALIPQVVAQAVVENNGTKFGDRASEWLVGGEVRWNVSLGGGDVERLKAASHARVRAAAEADDVRAAVQVEVVTAYRRLEAAVARQEAGTAAVDQARESERIVRDRFDAGLATVTDVLRGASAVLDAEGQRTSALVDALVSDAMLARAIGRSP